MAQKKYVSLSRLSTFLDNLKTTFSSLSHKHKLSDITDYTVDSTLSSTSTNPVQNNVIKASLDEKVPNTRAVNGKVLSADITLSASDIGSYTKAETDSKIEEAKSYTDTKTSGLASTTVVDNKISTHNTSAAAHNDIRVLITDLTTKLNNFLDVDDTTTDQLSEVLTLIENNRGTLESLTTNKVNVSDIIDNLTTNNSSKVLSAAQGVAIKNLIDALQTTVNGKQNTITGGASTITSSNLTSNRALVSNGSGKVAISDITSTELGYLDGVTANVQTQLNAKAASSHTHDYAGSSSAGGAATSANKLNTDAGSVTQPVYFKDGVPVSTSHTLNADVPENAKFTDTTYEVATQSTDGLLSADDKIQLNNGGIPIVTTSGNGSAYTATVDGISTLTAGMKVTIIPHVTSTTMSPTLNVNSLGAKSIRMPITYNSSATSVGSVTTWIVKNVPITVEYDGTYWKTISCPRPSAQYLYGTVPVSNGGTGLTSVTSNSFLIGNGTSNMVEKTSSEVLDLITDGNMNIEYVNEYNTPGTFISIGQKANDENNYVYINGDLTITGEIYTSGVYKLCYHPGDTVTIERMYCAGGVTGSGKNLYFYVPLASPLWRVYNATISNPGKALITARKAEGGYIAHNVNVSSLGTPSCVPYENGVSISITASSAYNVTNNTPVTVTVKNLTLEFSSM